MAHTRDFDESEALTMRPMAPDDADAFIDLVRDVESIRELPESWVPYDEDGLRSLLDEENAMSIGLFDGDQLVGTAFLSRPGHTLLSDSDVLPLCGLPSKGTAELTHIMLSSDWRGNGYANGMVDDLVKAADGARGIRRIYALVHPYDKQSRKLFERSCFVSCCSARVPDGRELHIYQRWFEDRSKG